MLDINKFIERMQTPTSQLKRKELVEREEFWRALWSWIPENVKYYLLKVGQTVRIVRRDYRGSLGELGQATFEMTELEVDVYEKTYNYSDGKWYFERKVVKIPKGAITMMEFIATQEDAEVVEKYEVESLAEEESVEAGV